MSYVKSSDCIKIWQCAGDTVYTRLVHCWLWSHLLLLCLTATLFICCPFFLFITFFFYTILYNVLNKLWISEETAPCVCVMTDLWKEANVNREWLKLWLRKKINSQFLMTLDFWCKYTLIHIYSHISQQQHLHTIRSGQSTGRWLSWFIFQCNH